MVNAKSEEGIVDKMSDLPDELLRRIFSFLASHHSIRLSSLSSRYRYLWRSVPVLDFWDNHYPKDCFEKVMENALKQHENLANIWKFRLWCIGLEYKRSVISKWINTCTTPSCSTLQVFDIHLARKYRLNLTPTIFSCRKLERIRLSGGIIIDQFPINTHAFFPCLKTLRFKSISIVGGNKLNMLLSGCSRIEIFDIEDCLILSDISTHTFTLNKLYIKYQLKPCRIDEDADSNRVLSLASATIVDITFPYHNFQLTFDLFMSISGIVKQLEICMFKLDEFLYHGEPIVRAPSVFYYNLHTVKIDGVDGAEEMEIVRYFLKNALDLKKLIKGTRKADEEIKARIVNEPRASSHCKIEFLCI